MRLVPGACGGLANGVDESHTLEPLLIGQLNLTNEVVEMPNQLSHDESRPVGDIGSNGVDDSVGKVWIEAVRAVILDFGRLLCVWVHDECAETRKFKGKTGYQENLRGRIVFSHDSRPGKELNK